MCRKYKYHSQKEIQFNQNQFKINITLTQQAFVFINNKEF